MKRGLIITALVLFSATMIQGQFRISMYAGYGLSQFDDELFTEDVLDQTTYLPVGASVEYGLEMFTFGIEANYSVLPFTFDMPVYELENAWELEITQLVIGGFVKVRFRDISEINPYIRAGLGYYGGKGRNNYSDEFKQLSTGLEDTESDFEPAIGFNGGIGMDFPVSNVSFLYLEGIYHFVQRKYDIPNAESFKANNFAFFLGFTYKL
jgi:hypothetical protein